MVHQLQGPPPDGKIPYSGWPRGGGCIADRPTLDEPRVVVSTSRFQFQLLEACGFLFGNRFRHDTPPLGFGACLLLVQRAAPPRDHDSDRDQNYDPRDHGRDSADQSRPGERHTELGLHLGDEVSCEKIHTPHERDAQRQEHRVEVMSALVGEPDVGSCFEEAVVRRIDERREVVVERPPDDHRLDVASAEEEQQDQADAAPDDREHGVGQYDPALHEDAPDRALLEGALIDGELLEPQVHEPPPELGEPGETLARRLLREEFARHVDRVFGDVVDLRDIGRDAGRHAVGETLDVLTRLVILVPVDEERVALGLVRLVDVDDEAMDAMSPRAREAHVEDRCVEVEQMSLHL